MSNARFGGDGGGGDLDDPPECWGLVGNEQPQCGAPQDIDKASGQHFDAGGYWAMYSGGNNCREWGQAESRSPMEDHRGDKASYELPPGHRRPIPVRSKGGSAEQVKSQFDLNYDDTPLRRPARAEGTELGKGGEGGRDSPGKWEC